MERVKDVIAAASRFSIGTIISRLSGLFRDIGIAYAFGVGVEIAGFMVAFRLANLFRRLLGEGVLQTGFVPIYERLKGQDMKLGAKFYRDMFYSVAMVAMLFIAIGSAIIFLVKGFFDYEWGEILTLTSIMLVSLLWICLFGLDAAFLQAERKSFWAGFAPSLFNFGILGSSLIASFSPEPMKALAFGVVLSFALQWAVAARQVFQTLKHHLTLKEWLNPSLFSEEIKQACLAVGFGLIGTCAMQLNSALDAVFARIADPSGPAYLWYAIRLYQLPIALVAIALSSALLPALARRRLEEDVLFDAVMNPAVEMILICAFALFAFATPGVNLLFGHGHFSAADVAQTVKCLWAYGIGFIPAALVLLAAQKHFAKRSFKTPVVASLCSVAFHLCLNTALIFWLKLGAISIALSTSAGAVLNAYLLFRERPLRVAPPIRLCAICAASTIGCFALDQVFGGSRELWRQLLHLGLSGILFCTPLALLYGVSAWKASKRAFKLRWRRLKIHRDGLESPGDKTWQR